MDIQSVTSNASAYASALNQTSQTQQAQQTQQSQQTQQTQQAEKREPKAAERVEFKEEAPRPVKNAQGQETGRLINVIA